MSRTLSAILLGLLMVMMPLAGCVSDGTDGLQGPEGPEGPPGVDGSTLHLVVAESDLPECNTDLQGQIYFVSSDGAFQVCSTMGWSVVDLTGPAGADGTNGTDGLPGADGDDGTNGTDGVDGTNGLSALAVTSIESAGLNCADGGVKIEVGLDQNSNGSLDEDEVHHTQYVCNGADGQNGLDGDDGSASPNTMLTSISKPTLEACSSGGSIINQGLDNGDGGGIAQNGILESVEIDHTTTYCSNFVITRLTDLTTNQGSSPWGNGVSSFSRMTAMGTSVYFAGYTVPSGITGGYELTAFDSATGETKTIANLGGTSSGFTSSQSVVVGTTLFFEGFVEGVGRSLVAYESTNDSTWVVRDLCPTSTSLSSGSYCGKVSDFTVMGTKVFFSGRTGTSYPWNDELWVHDTTNDSTWQVVDIYSGGNSGVYVGGTDYAVMGTRLYFAATDGSSGQELWAHETTNDSTWQVANINEGNGQSGEANYITAMGTRIYFQGNGATFTTGSTGYELWAHETTNDSTWLVADINLHASQPHMGSTSDSSHPSYITGIGTRLYFRATDGISGTEVWVHETTNGSTWQVSDILAGSGGSSPRFFVTIGSQVFFIADDGLFDNELWMMEIEHTITYS